MTASGPPAELDLLVIGDVNPDIIVAGLETAPRFDQVEQLVDRADLVAGGSGAMTAIGAARLGLRVGMCGAIGDDRFGAFMGGELTRAGVFVERVKTVETIATGVTVVLLQDENRAILTAPGCINQLTASDLAALPDRPARHVHIASYYLMAAEFHSALPAALRRFRTAGTSVSVDTNWDPHELWRLDAVLSETDIFLPNRAELLAVSHAANVKDGLLTLAPESLTVVTKLGEWGAVARMPGGACWTVRATTNGGFVDSVGAGDAFNAGYLTGLLDGRQPQECLRLAVAAGTLSTRSHGGTAAQLSRGELDQLAGAMVCVEGLAESA